MQVINERTALVAVDKLRQHPENPRQGDLEAVEESIRQNGFFGTVVAQKSTKYVLAGNHRLQAARNLGIGKIPVVWVDVDDKAAKRILLADNRTSDLATYDDATVLRILQELQETEAQLQGTGYDENDLNRLQAILDGLKGRPEPRDPDPTKADELQKKWKVERGQIWHAGPHRLLCGDCLAEEAWETLMAEQFGKAHLVVTDPPYNVASTGGPNSKQWVPIGNDQMDDFTAFCSAIGVRLQAMVRPGAAIYVFMSSSEWATVDGALKRAGFHWSSVIIWAKHHATLGRRDYQSKFEPFWYGWDSRAARLHPLEDRTQTDVWEFPRPAKSEYHPTQKPVALLARAIENSSREGELVIDPFSGSFSTMIAADSLGRRCYGSDIEPKFVAVGLEEMAHRGHEPVMVEKIDA